MISPDALDFTSTVSTGSMAPDADADTTKLRRSTGTASYDCAACVFLQPARPASSNAAAPPPPPPRFPKVLCSRLTFHPLIARNLAVEQVNLAVRVRRNVVFVRHQHDGLARVV